VVKIKHVKRGDAMRGRPKYMRIRNPYRTGDGRFVLLTCLQAGKYWAETCAVVGLPEPSAG